MDLGMAQTLWFEVDCCQDVMDLTRFETAKIMLLSNFGESGPQLGIHFRGEYLIGVTLVETNLDIDK